MNQAEQKDLPTRRVKSPIVIALFVWVVVIPAVVVLAASVYSVYAKRRSSRAARRREQVTALERAKDSFRQPTPGAPRRIQRSSYPERRIRARRPI
jgi:hypothetical protein